MKILVTGGAGYIGSFMTKKLLDNGHEVVVVDSLEKGHKESVDSGSSFISGNLLDKQFVKSVFEQHKIDAVIHFAAYISMAESMQKPGVYFENNVYGLINVLDAMVQKGVKKIIFSSTAGVYGNPIKVPISEDHPKEPTNPYGESKLMAERVLVWYQKIHGVNFVALRYFNAAGASLDGDMGENHAEETHIIPNVMRALIEEKEFVLYGDTYDTPDGSCIRDYIHVLDLANAHDLALKKLQNEEGGFYYNVGTGNGNSNKEVIAMIEKVSNRKLSISIADKRPGDANILVADVTKIKKELGFEPQYSDLETVVKTAWAWHTRKQS